MKLILIIFYFCRKKLILSHSDIRKLFPINYTMSSAAIAAIATTDRPCKSCQQSIVRPAHHQYCPTCHRDERNKSHKSDKSDKYEIKNNNSNHSNYSKPSKNFKEEFDFNKSKHFGYFGKSFSSSFNRYPQTFPEYRSTPALDSSETKISIHLPFSCDKDWFQRVHTDDKSSSSSLLTMKSGGPGFMLPDIPLEQLNPKCVSHDDAWDD